MKLTKSKSIVISNIVSNIDFNKIHAVMEFLNWNWYCNKDYKVPSTDEIKEFLINQLDTFFDENLKSVESGGFVICREYNDVHIRFDILNYLEFNVFEKNK